MIVRLLLVAGAHVGVALVASWLDGPGSGLGGFLFMGVLAGQFAILGLWLGLGDRSIATRLAIAFFTALGLCWVYMLRPLTSGWELLLVGVRLGILAIVFLSIRKQRHHVLRRQGGSNHPRLIQIGLKHLLALTLAVALFLAFVRASKGYNRPSGDMLMLLFVLIVGLAAALIPMVAAAGSLSERTLAGAIPYAVVVFVLAAAMGTFAYVQTDNWGTGLEWVLGSLVEAITVSTSILLTRLRGYRLTPLVTV